MDGETRKAIREAFRQGHLTVKAVDPETGAAGLYPISDVMQHCTGHKTMIRLGLADGRSAEVTEDHSVFFCTGSGIRPVRADEISVGDSVATVVGMAVVPIQVTQIDRIDPQEFTYDLSVPGPENFVLTNGILAHNSYSIGGISLDIEKSSKYESLKQNAEQQFDKAAEAKQRTVKYIRGLQQPRFGLGVRSSFGPAVGAGIMTPRAFLVWAFLLITGGTLMNILGG